jgi:peptidoglycan/LPS O-acetylase OafA/YrhL
VTLTLPVASSCQDLLSAGVGTVAWVVIGGALGVVAGIRTFPEAHERRGMRPLNWVAAAVFFAGCVGGLAYIASAPGDRCSSPTVQVFFLFQPFVLCTFVGATIAYLASRRSGSEERRGDDGEES